MKRILFITLLIFFEVNIHAQIERVEPPNWWVGFKDTSLQLLVKGNGIGNAIPHIDYDGITIQKVSKAKSPNYLFIDLLIDKGTKPGKFVIKFDLKKKRTLKYEYELKQRLLSAEEYVGFDSSDVIYLITPDRFANGNPSNDINKNLKEETINRADDYGRHGGDIKGITQHIDYIKNMGFTAVWPTPLLMNDMPNSSYHGYAITDFYEVDPRFGTLDEYIELSSKLKQQGLKLIMDMVANHCGSEHWWMKDLPFDDWLNYQKLNNSQEKLITSNHRRTTNQDLYASKKDSELMTQGWFVSAMPDLNQRNPFMANYLIQNSIWWIETLQLGGIRQDTYPYPDKDFMSDWAGAIMNEYPNFNIVGEEWSYNPLLVGYWQQGTHNKDGYVSNLKTTMDFPMQQGVVDALNEPESWATGLVKIYEGLANDFYYPNPESILIFGDNHDMDRVYTQLKKDLTNMQMAMSFYLLAPRIPQVYYGTEILKENSAKRGDHGLIRSDFPGGWADDAINGFTGEGLSNEQLQMQSFLRKLLNYRKNSEAIHHGKTIHFAPQNGIYLLSRFTENEQVILFLNKNENPAELDLNRFEELGLSGKKLLNIITNDELIWNDKLTFTQRGAVLLTTKTK